MHDDESKWAEARVLALKNHKETDEAFSSIVKAIFKQLGGTVGATAQEQSAGNGDVVYASEAEPADLILCRAQEGAGNAIDSSKLWRVGEECSFMYLPAGVHSITAGFRGKAIALTVEVEPVQTAETIQASMDSLVADAPKQKPFGCIEHDEREASVWPKRFMAKDDGVYLAAEPSALGATNVNGKIHRSWSPSFTTDADYAQAKLEGEGERGVYRFPDGVRGSRTNPAHITGVGFCVGTLTNKPAFRNIAPVKAKDERDKVTASGTSEGVRKEWETRHRLSKTHFNTALDHTDIALSTREKQRAENDPVQRVGLEQQANLHSAKASAYYASAHAYADTGSHERAEELHHEAAYQSEKRGDKEGAKEHKEQAEEHRQIILTRRHANLYQHGLASATDATSTDTVKATWSDAARKASAEARNGHVVEQRSGSHDLDHYTGKEYAEKLSERAHAASEHAEKEGDAYSHAEARSAHDSAAMAHSKWGDKEVAVRHKQKAAHHWEKVTSSFDVKSTDATPSVDTIFAKAETVRPRRPDEILKIVRTRQTAPNPGQPLTAETVFARYAGQ